MTDADGNTGRFEYLDGRLVTIVDPLGRRTGIEYDQNGRRSLITNPAGGPPGCNTMRPAISFAAARPMGRPPRTHIVLTDRSTRLSIRRGLFAASNTMRWVF